MSAILDQIVVEYHYQSPTWTDKRLLMGNRLRHESDVVKVGTLQVTDELGRPVFDAVAMPAGGRVEIGFRLCEYCEEQLASDAVKDAELDIAYVCSDCAHADNPADDDLEDDEPDYSLNRAMQRGFDEGKDRRESA